MLFVGLRYYSPDAKNIDQHGKAYEGWTETYDTWIPAYSTRIQKFVIHIIYF